MQDRRNSTDEKRKKKTNKPVIRLKLENWVRRDQMTALKEQDEGPIINEPQHKKGRLMKCNEVDETDSWIVARGKSGGSEMKVIVYRLIRFVGTEWWGCKRKSGDDLTKSFTREQFYFLPDDDDKKPKMKRHAEHWQENIPFVFVNNNQQTTIICLSFGFL